MSHNTLGRGVTFDLSSLGLQALCSLLHKLGPPLFIGEAYFLLIALLIPWIIAGEDLGTGEG